MVTICATCLVSQHCTFPTVYLHVKQTARTSTGTMCANNACGHSLSNVQQLCQTSTGNRQTNNVVFVSTIRNWHCTLLVLSVQNVRHCMTKCIWCVYNTGTLFYLTVHIITFTRTVSYNGNQWSAYSYSHLPWARVHTFSSTHRS